MLRAKAREIGACRILGNKMVLLQEDVDKLLEATKISPAKAENQAIRLALDGDDFETLIARRKREQAAKRSAKPATPRV